ncbi:MAG TPA: DUF433 domain-containing protein [Roseiflexaceae bacterium]|nr:DUF433 domain-containing protein [Roseiflexaceae bacterium]
MSIATANRYIVKDQAILGGEPIIVSTRTPVRAIVELWNQGNPPEMIPQHLPHLTLAQIFDALSYYSDNQEEIQKYIEKNKITDDMVDRSIKNI